MIQLNSVVSQQGTYLAMHVMLLRAGGGVIDCLILDKYLWFELP